MYNVSCFHLGGFGSLFGGDETPLATRLLLSQHCIFWLKSVNKACDLETLKVFALFPGFAFCNFTAES